jgi:hypothetical protein
MWARIIIIAIGSNNTRLIIVKRYWLSFDLGLHGNYDGLFEWLDKQEAQECGDSVATFRSDWNRDRIARELKSILRGTKNARVYLISMKEGGRFILGRRKVSPWKGYAQVSVDSSESDEA